MVKKKNAFTLKFSNDFFFVNRPAFTAINNHLRILNDIFSLGTRKLELAN